MIGQTLESFLNESTDEDKGRIVLGIAESGIKIKRTVELGEDSYSGTKNASGDEQTSLDNEINEIIINAMGNVPCVGELASEEEDEIVRLRNGIYSVGFDPLDGSSKLPYNQAVGTIASVHEGKILEGSGADTIVAAMYMVYGPRTTLMLSVGDGTHEFRFKDNVWRLSKEGIIMADEATRYHSGEARASWSDGHRKFIESLESDGQKNTFTGVLVSEMNYVLHNSQIFTYPATVRRNGVHRLLTEAQPMAFLAEQAGGVATAGIRRILDIVPHELHQTTPLYIGPKNTVLRAAKYLK